MGRERLSGKETILAICDQGDHSSRGLPFGSVGIKIALLADGADLVVLNVFFENPRFEELPFVFKGQVKIKFSIALPKRFGVEALLKFASYFVVTRADAGAENDPNLSGMFSGLLGDGF